MLTLRKVLALTCIVVSSVVAANAQSGINPEYQTILSRDAPGGADNPLAGRYEGSVLLGQSVAAFNELILPSGPATGKTYDNDRKFTATVRVQGKAARSIYISPEGRSTLEVFTNYRDHLLAAGFLPVFECVGAECGESFADLKYSPARKETIIRGTGYEQARNLTIERVFDANADIRYALLKKADSGGDSWVAIFAAMQSSDSTPYHKFMQGRVAVLLESVEPRAMERRIVTVKAEEIAAKVSSDGRAVFYGIQFDFDKADIKPDSEPQLAEMARFLKMNGAPRIYVIGHTDNKGTLDYNLTLSGRRAAAVIRALSERYGVDARRLVARGLGPLAPLASNLTGDGQAKNRRVEMVAQ